MGASSAHARNSLARSHLVIPGPLSEELWETEGQLNSPFATPFAPIGTGWHRLPFSIGPVCDRGDRTAKPHPQFARRARVRGRTRAITPPLRQHGIKPHGYALFATTGKLDGYPKSAICSALSRQTTKGRNRVGTDGGCGVGWARQGQGGKADGGAALARWAIKPRKTTDVEPAGKTGGPG